MSINSKLDPGLPLIRNKSYEKFIFTINKLSEEENKTVFRLVALQLAK